MSAVSTANANWSHASYASAHQLYGITLFGRAAQLIDACELKKEEEASVKKKLVYVAMLKTFSRPFSWVHGWRIRAVQGYF